MALPSNVVRFSTGAMLPFFSAHPTPGFSGVSVLSQSPDIHPPLLFFNPYVFPPICLIPNVPQCPVARVFVPAVKCPECEYLNDQDFRFCQICEFKRPAVSATLPLSVAPDICVVNSRVDQLRGIAFSSAPAGQRESLKREFSAFLGYLPGLRPFFPPLLKIFVDFLLGKIPE